MVLYFLLFDRNTFSFLQSSSAQIFNASASIIVLISEDSRTAFTMAPDSSPMPRPGPTITELKPFTFSLIQLQIASVSSLS